MIRLSKILYGPLAVSVLCSCSQEELISITKQEVTQNEEVGRFDNGQYYTAYRPISYEKIVITVKTKAITIKGISANKGNCVVNPFVLLPAQLRFGETLTARVECDPIEVAAETDRGVLTLSW